eukprot:747074-Hanusia_phi.AAC.2
MAAELLRMKRAKMRGGRSGREGEGGIGGREGREGSDRGPESLLMGVRARGGSQGRGGIRAQVARQGDAGFMATKMVHKGGEDWETGIIQGGDDEFEAKIADSFLARSSTLERMRREILKELSVFPKKGQVQEQHDKYPAKPNVLRYVLPHDELSHASGPNDKADDGVERMLMAMTIHARLLREFEEKRSEAARHLWEKRQEVEEAKSSLRWRLSDVTWMRMRVRQEREMERVLKTCSVGYYKFKQLTEMVMGDEKKRLVECDAMKISNVLYESLSWKIFNLRLFQDNRKSPKLVLLGRNSLQKKIVEYVSKRLRDRQLEGAMLESAWN